MAADEDFVRFRAIFPSIQSAIKIAGSGDGMRIQLDIPEDQMPDAVRLLMMRECVLDVTIRPVEMHNDGEKTIHRRTKNDITAQY